MELSCQEQNAFTTKRSILKTKPELYRPYGWICFGNCMHCKDVSLSRRRKLKSRREAEFIIFQESKE